MTLSRPSAGVYILCSLHTIAFNVRQSRVLKIAIVEGHPIELVPDRSKAVGQGCEDQKFEIVTVTLQ